MSHLEQLERFASTRVPSLSQKIDNWRHLLQRAREIVANATLLAIFEAMEIVEGAEPKLSVVIPNWNEEQAIPVVLSQLSELKLSDNSDFEVIVVDDGSTDLSVELLEAHPMVRLIRHSKNQGYGAAIKTGIRASRGRIVAFLDMDGTYHVPDLDRFSMAIDREGRDMIVGDRLTESSEMEGIRRLGNRVFSTSVSWLFGREIKDCCSGMRVVRGPLLRQLLPSLPDDLDFALALTLTMITQKMNFVEYPTEYRLRIGDSKLSEFADGVRFLARIAQFRVSELF